MSAHRNQYLRIGINILLVLSMFSMLTACQDGLFSGGEVTSQPQAIQSTLDEQPSAEGTCEAQSLTPFGETQNLYIEILDEVTGLALNAAKVQMEKQDAHTFVIKMPVTVGSMVKYRYVRDQDPFGYEYTSLGKQVRYRLFMVDGPGIARDTISGWKADPLTSNTGRIQGQIAIEGTNAPVINALVAAGGMHTLTASDGSYMLEGLPAGLHNHVV